ncbi:protein ImuB [Nakamurella panacisegetis]|uniref:Protein ImuB n=1 Tax=Nakamurella panacisegetis TaxID=1090615 RepID=A0A1H0R694_9ACTN|nr:DNA polymerase Y family protein [Nakamurella panacisegetis]SDP24576.1 protein ImuB [Nakamurella panacisegetis]
MNTAPTDIAPERSRTLVIWCPDWPAVAGARQAGKSPSEPVAVFHANRVQTCNRAARSEGIGVGQRRRDAQSRYPDLLVLKADPDRDARLFEPVVAAVESVAPGVEILRPGLVACSSRGPTRFFGSETEAAERIVDLVEALDVECSVGIADSLAVAVLAARQVKIVSRGGSATFCAGLPIVELARDPAIAPPERMDLIDLLIRLGIHTAGAFAALPDAKVATRFGADAVVAHRLAKGEAERGLSRRSIPEELAVEQPFDPPLERVDSAAFAAKALAERFHARLGDAGLACTRLAISATTDRGGHLSRIWRCARPLTPAATADRLRWQLDGWLTAGRTRQRTEDDDDTGPGGITSLRLEPIEAIGAGLVQYGLWGSDGQDDQRAGWAFARVQGLLGPQSVLTPVLSGGRGPGERITLLPWGEEKVPARDPSAPWPGALPAPTPSRLAGPDTTVTMLDDLGSPVVVTDRGMLSGAPSRLHGKAVDPCWIQSWAGPWLLDERWWTARPEIIQPPAPSPARAEYRPAPGDLDYRKPRSPRPEEPVGTGISAPARHSARLQVLPDTGPALLLLFGVDGWQVEGVYD